MNVHRHRRPRSPFRAGRGMAAVTVAALTAGLALVVSPAHAAGNGVLDLVVTPTLPDGSTATDLSASSTATNIVYKVQYSCTAADCDATRVAFSEAPWQDPQGLNPKGNSVLRWASWVQPAGGATISSTNTLVNDRDGVTVNLGNLAAGTSGTFSMTYAGGGTTTREIMAGQFFPEGAVLPLSATATSTSASPKTADAPLTWHAGTVPPTGLGTGIGGNHVTKPGVTINSVLTMGTGSVNTTGGDGQYVATGSYKVVYHAPPQAVIGAVTYGDAAGAVDPVAVVDNAAHTITWTVGSAANPSFAARGGWGANVATSTQAGYGNGTANSLVGSADQAFFGRRSVALSFPASNFPEADANGCNFKTTVTSSMDVSATYLDPAHTTRSASSAATDTVACSSPFGGWTNVGPTKNVQTPGNQTAAGDADLGAGVYAVNVPAPGKSDTVGREWRINVNNRGNVGATAVIDDDLSGEAPIRVNRITAYPNTGAEDPATWQTSVAWTDNTGATGTSTLGAAQYVDAAAGRWFTQVHAEMPIKAGATLRTDTTSVGVSLGLRIKVDDGSDTLIGQTVTNAADVKLVYPADADGDGSDDAYTDLAGNPFPSRQVSARTTRTVKLTQPSTLLTVQFLGSAIQGGGTQVRPGTNVLFSARGVTGAAWPGTSITPQTVFVAPLGWSLVHDAAYSSPGQGVFASIPAGVTYRYGTGTFADGVRDYVVATYPSTVTLDTDAAKNWPTLSVTAFPTNAAVPGVLPRTDVWAGDDSGLWTKGSGAGAMSDPHQFRIGSGQAAATDTPDVDGDGNTGEQFASDSASNNLAVGATDSLSVVKQLCVPLQGAPDGCSWVSDSSAHLVPADAGTVKYRLQVRNDGNTTIHHAVAYDLLPRVGDTSALAAASPRGSEFALPLKSVDSVDPGLTIAGSEATNPARPEVFPGATGTTDDWGTPAAGDKALRIAVDGDLPVGAEKDVVFSSRLAGATQGQKACNSVAADSEETLPSEPRAVCVTLDAPLNVAPTVTIANPTDGAALAYGSSVTNAFSCDDVDGNLASCVGTDENGATVANGSTVDTTATGTHTLTVKATDTDGATGTRSVTYTVNRKPNVAPTVTITKPTDGATYFVGQHVPAAYTCADSDGTVVSCTGPVATGANIDTATAGTKAFKVTATDNEGATASKTVTYKVVTVAGTCRGTGMSLLGIGLGVANPKTTPCATDTDKEVSVNVVITSSIPLLGVPANTVSASVITGATQSGPGSAAAQAGVASVKISVLGQTIEATGLTSSASSVLSSCGTPAALSGVSSLASLKINGRSVANLDQPNLTVPLIVGSLGINERGMSGNTVTASALHLNVLGVVDLAVGQSVAGATC